MNSTTIDRFLLTVAICALAVVGHQVASAATPNCSPQCQGQVDFAIDQGGGISCQHYSTPDCTFCANGNCLAFVGPSLPNCFPDFTSVLTAKTFTPCNLACSLPPGGGAQAKPPGTLDTRVLNLGPPSVCTQ